MISQREALFIIIFLKFSANFDSFFFLERAFKKVRDDEIKTTSEVVSL